MRIPIAVMKTPPWPAICRSFQSTTIIPKAVAASEIEECEGGRKKHRTGSFLKVPGQVADGQLVEPVVAVHRRRRWRRRRRHGVRRRLAHRRRGRPLPCRRWRRRHALMRPRHDRPHGGTTKQANNRLLIIIPPRVAAASSFHRLRR